MCWGRFSSDRTEGVNLVTDFLSHHIRRVKRGNHPAHNWSMRDCTGNCAPGGCDGSRSQHLFSFWSMTAAGFYASGQPERRFKPRRDKRLILDFTIRG
jgi:hypothetical protein